MTSSGTGGDCRRCQLARRVPGRRRRAGLDGLDDAITAKLTLPPVVLTEVTSAPRGGEQARALLRGLPTLQLTEGYWERAGVRRGRVLASGFRARLADALIAQSCIDYDVALITRDRDFRHFVRHGLRLAS